MLILFSIFDLANEFYPTYKKYLQNKAGDGFMYHSFPGSYGFVG
jgi:hypothetical protein